MECSEQWKGTEYVPSRQGMLLRNKGLRGSALRLRISRPLAPNLRIVSLQKVPIYSLLAVLYRVRSPVEEKGCTHPELTPFLLPFRAQVLFPEIWACCPSASSIGGHVCTQRAGAGQGPCWDGREIWCLLLQCLLQGIVCRHNWQWRGKTTRVDMLRHCLEMIL